MRAHSEIIKNSVTIRQVVEFYGFRVNRTGFIKCPIHREKTPSMKIYKDNRGFYCYGCKAGGSVIDFVMKLFELDFKTAVSKLDDDFNLNLGNRKISKYEKMKIAIKEDLRKQEILKYKQAEDHYWKMFDEWKRLDDNKRKYKPKTMDENYHDLFVEALQKLCYQEYLLDIAEMRLRDYELRGTKA